MVFLLGFKDIRSVNENSNNFAGMKLHVTCVIILFIHTMILQVILKSFMKSKIDSWSFFAVRAMI